MPAILLLSACGLWMLIGLAVLVWLLSDQAVRNDVRNLGLGLALAYGVCVVAAWPELLVHDGEGR